jgi:hypothetical protein
MPPQALIEAPKNIDDLVEQIGDVTAASRVVNATHKRHSPRVW